MGDVVSPRLYQGWQEPLSMTNGLCRLYWRCVPGRLYHAQNLPFRVV
jgi:hypothetical protein